MSPNSQALRKHPKKGENPIRITPVRESASGSGPRTTWTCKNSACRAEISIFDTFCKRCTCYICLEFDDNKDPSLWLSCANDSLAESCGLSCHVECALQRRIVGVVDPDQSTHLDGHYICSSCGKISDILLYWKRLLTIAKDSRRVDVLCYRLNLCFRLFDGTSRFRDVHNIINEAISKLEAKVDPLSGVSARLARGLVSRLPVAAEVIALCNAAIEKADEDVTVHQNEETPRASGPSQTVNPNPSKADGVPSSSRRHPVIFTVPDLNEEACPSEADHGNSGSENCAQFQHGPNNNNVLVVDSRGEVSRKCPATTEARVCENMSPLPAHNQGSGDLDEQFENCVKVLRWLEHEGCITEEFRLKLLTWFGLRSTERERRVVNSFIRILRDDPRILAGQLVDSFSDIINKKRRN